MIEALKTNKPVIGKISANIYLTCEDCRKIGPI